MYYQPQKLYNVKKVKTIVGAKLACIKGATAPGLTGYTPQYHKLLRWIFFSPE